MFDPKQIAALEADLGRNHVKTRKQSGRSLSYIEGWHAIAEANRIFGFDGWHRDTIEVRCVAERQRTIGESKREGWGVSYIARVRVTVFAGERQIVRNGTGSGHGIDVDLGLAHESAIKEAETDAMKRALMTFGNPFGLALYDKEQRAVSNQSASHSADDDKLSRAIADDLIADIAKAPTVAALDKIATSDAFKATYRDLSDDDRHRVKEAGARRKSELTPRAA